MNATNRLSQLDPDLKPGRFTFVSVPEMPADIQPLASVVEPEGVSLVLEVESAEAMGLRYEFVAAVITLRIHSSLEGVGLTATVSAALAEAEIACNVIAGYHHDHLLVPYERAEQALEVLLALAGRG